MSKQLEQFYRKKAEFIVLLGGKCVSCDATTGLQFHHKDPKKKSFDIGRFYSSKKVYAELKKCELRCELHHKQAHAAMHGTEYYYRRYKCRCDACVKAFREKCKKYMQAYRKRKLAL